MPIQRRHFLASTAACCIALPSLTHAQAFPSRPVTIIVSFPAGGPSDVMARAVANGLSAEWRQPVVVENRPGAGAIVGTSAVLAAPADGHTLLLTSNVFTTAQWLFPKLPFDPLRDFRAVCGLVRSPQMAIVSTRFPGNNLADLARLARERPGGLDYASVGNGTLPHLLTEAFKKAAGIYMTHIPYRGSAGAHAAVMAGDVATYFDAQISSQALLRAGKIKALGVTGRERTAQFPGVATFAEQGFADFENYTWFGLVARSATPDALTQRLNEAVNRAMATPDAVELVASLGATPTGGASKVFQEVLVNDTARWGRVIREAGIRLD